ncbi:TPA: hypothetical protein N0F65_009374 [Lagenidium giganteum]|uniref:DNA primase large subunit n=1 Tax=Lagenidium giganteum TaxID=4803 RepID=A0AAV2ZB86_9STRA|nr:TPA: hypothetical protein N0F65_009374 [Lagenidium giganteum]
MPALGSYETPPGGAVSLDDVELSGAMRLHALSTVYKCGVVELVHRGKSPPVLDDVDTLVNDWELDTTSHHVLRLAFCSVQEMWEMFVDLESALFAYRLTTMSTTAPIQLLACHGHSYRKRITNTEHSTEVFEVPFIEASSLIRRRRVRLEHGIALVPMSDMAHIAIHHFKELMIVRLRSLRAAILINRQEYERLYPLLEHLRAIATKLLSRSCEIHLPSRPRVALHEIDIVAERHFPLCMKHLHHKLRSNNHLKYDGRVQYRMFLKGLGLSAQENLEFWRSAFTKIMATSKFEKEYAYNIRHSYGLEGARKDYEPLNCQQIVSGGAPRNGQYHGCPFNHWGTYFLRAQLANDQRISHGALDHILRSASSGNPQEACRRYFDALHPNASTGSDVAMHPNLEQLDKDVSNFKLLSILRVLKETVGAGVNCAALVLSLMASPVDAVNAAVEQVMNAPAKKKWQQKRKAPREFNQANYQKRHMALKFLYMGEKYAGFARQDHMDETIERYLIDALKQTKLIEDINTCNYSRCGRTDRGVSAFGQVAGITLRSNVPAGAELLDHASIDDVRPGEKVRVKLANGTEKTVTEVDYAVHINRSLPEDIRVYAATSARDTFDARFDCRGRVYRYFFVRKNLDIERMRTAAKSLVGLHDYRNFCRIDTNCQTFNRRIKEFNIVKCDSNVATSSEDQVYRFEIHGMAFLWHQVRCMVSVLFMIGEGREEPSVIERLLDIEANPRKPQYDMASDLPLVLHDCIFEDVTFGSSNSPHSPLALHHVHDSLSAQWEQHTIRAAILKSNLAELDSFRVHRDLVVEDLDHFSPKLEQLLAERFPTSATEPVAWHQVRPLLPLASRRRYFPLFTRMTSDSVDEKKHKMKERKRRRNDDASLVVEVATAQQSDPNVAANQEQARE